MCPDLINLKDFLCDTGLVIQSLHLSFLAGNIVDLVNLFSTSFWCDETELSIPERFPLEGM